MGQSASLTQPKRILITGASGYIALNIINQLAATPHKIRATVRNLNDKSKVEIVQRAAEGSRYPIEIVSADLLKPDSWTEACKDVDVVMHVASPFPAETPADPEKDLYQPAVQGTKNVLTAAFKAGVSRVVLTSSCVSIYDLTAKNKTFSESDWPDPEKSCPYAKSKILAERAAWDFVEDKKKKGEACFELAVINPCFVFGPSLGDPGSMGTSEQFISSFFKLEKTKEMIIGHCDVRDVALAHIRAAFIPQAAGHRHIIESENKWISNKRTYEILKKKYESQGYKISCEFEPTENPNNGSDNTRMKKILGIKPTSYEKTIIDMAESLIRSGVIKK